MGIEPVCFSRPLEVGEIALLAGSPETGAVGGGVGLALSAPLIGIAAMLITREETFGPVAGLTVYSETPQSITLAGAVLGWRPEVPLRDALARTCAWYRDELARTEDP